MLTNIQEQSKVLIDALGSLADLLGASLPDIGVIEGRDPFSRFRMLVAAPHLTAVSDIGADSIPRDPCARRPYCGAISTAKWGASPESWRFSKVMESATTAPVLPAELSENTGLST